MKFVPYFACSLSDIRSYQSVFFYLNAIRHLHISHNAPYLPPKILHNLRVSFLLGITAVPREIENNAYVTFWGANEVHYGRCVNGECSRGQYEF